MYELVIIAIYTVAILVFVPLEKIGHVQEHVKKQVKRLLDKAKS
jgi:hypothetical protein